MAIKWRWPSKIGFCGFFFRLRSVGAGEGPGWQGQPGGEGQEGEASSSIVVFGPQIIITSAITGRWGLCHYGSCYPGDKVAGGRDAIDEMNSEPENRCIRRWTGMVRWKTRFSGGETRESWEEIE